MALRGLTNDEKIWNYFLDKGMSKYGIAGLIGNLDCESALNPKNLEDAYQQKLGYTDDSYTAAVDNGTYSRFVNDCAGFGLAQWTHSSRKAGLFQLAKSSGCSIGDLELQLDFLWKELNGGFKPVLNILMNASSVRAASNAMLIQFESPLDQSISMQDRRCAISQKYYDKLSGGAVENATLVQFVCSIQPVNGYYIFKKGSRIQLTKNFWSYEFDCHGSGCCSETKISAKLVALCQQIRDHFKTSVTISSPYRCIIHNGGTKNAATNSRHTMGDACDIVVNGYAPRVVAAYCESIGILGIGLYETDADGHFVHIDVRDYKSFWYGQACAARTTFGGATVSTTVQPIQNNQNTGVLSSGSRGQAVKELQEKLIKLGYNIGATGADGEYGYFTMLAVKEFQKANGLSQDGIAGAKTLAAINSASTSNDESGDKYIVTANVLNVRAGNGTSYRVVGTVVKNTILTIKKLENGWGLTENGWVSMSYLQRKG